MRSHRKLCLSRKRGSETFEENACDTSDDFQDVPTVFRLPKKMRTSKVQGKTKTSVPKANTQEYPAPSTKKRPSKEHLTATSQQDQRVEKLTSDSSEEDTDLKEIEKSLCSESEHFCLTCKLIVPSAVYNDHLKQCLQKFKLVKKRCETKIPVVGREAETNDQEEQQSVLPCPVCRKPFKSKTQRVAHVKACAQEHGVTSEQLLQASRLQEKQAEEWSELGLPSALHLQNTRPKAPRTKRPREEDDPDIAIALALSRSIAQEEVEARTSREEQLLALGMETIVVEDRRAQPVLPQPPDLAKAPKKSTRGRKGCSRVFKTPLVTRSAGERERILSEKVAELLISADTTNAGWTDDGTPKVCLRLASRMNKQCQLWKAAKRGPEEPLASFYVPELEPHVYPKETVIGGLFRQLSQVPGRMNTTTLHALDEEYESEGEEEEENPEFEEFCTQIALAELMCTQEEQDTIEATQEQATEDMDVFLLSQAAETRGESKANTSVRKSDSEGETDDCVRVSDDEDNLEGRLDLERITDVSKLTEEPESTCKGKNDNIATSTQRQPTNVNHVTDNNIDNEPEYSDSKSETTSPSQNSQGKTSSRGRTTSQSVDVIPNTAKHSLVASESEDKEHNTLPSPSRGVTSPHIHSSKSCELDGKNGDADEGSFGPRVDSERREEKPSVTSDVCDKEQLEGRSRVRSQQYDKDRYTSPLKIYDSEHEKTVEFHEKQRCDGEDAGNHSEDDKLPGREGAVSKQRRETGVKDNVPYFTSGSMVDALIQDWKHVLQSGEGSDVTIITSDGSSLTAHSLVLLARCPRLYEETRACGVVKWDNVNKETANVFLSYLYAGTCEVTTRDDPLWIELYDVALQYNCTDLVSYMELLYKARSSPVEVRAPHWNRHVEPISTLVDKGSSVCLPGGEDKHATPSEERHVDLEDILELRDKPSNSTGNSPIKTTTDCGKTLKPTSHFNQQARQELEDRSSFEKSDSETDERSQRKHLQRVEAARSPDLFDVSCGSNVTSTSLHSPPLTPTSQHSPCVKMSEHREERNVCGFNTSPKTSSPSKLHLRVEGNKSRSSDKDVGECKLDVTVITSSPSLPPLSDGYELDAHDDVSDNDAVRSIRKESEADFFSDGDSPKKTGRTDHEDQETLIYEGTKTPEHYISNVWDDFDAGDSPIAVFECPSLSFDRPTPNTTRGDGKASLTPTTPSSSHHLASTPLSRHEHLTRRHAMHSVELKETERVRQRTESTETDTSEFTKKQLGDETMANIVAEAERWDDNDLRQSGYELQSKAVTAVTRSAVTTPHQPSTSRSRLVTPQPDYKNMKSPELKKELKKYGIRSLGRKKAVMVLQHIYEQTHPLITDSEAETSLAQTPQRPAEERAKSLHPKATRQEQTSNNKIPTRKTAAKKSAAAVEESDGETEEEDEDSPLNSSFLSSSSGSGGGSLYGDTVLSPEEEEVISSTQQADLASRVREMITGDSDLHRKVLLYEPIFVEDLHANLKSNKIRCSVQSLLDTLDELCVIVRTQTNQNKGHSRRRKNTAKKKT